MFFRIFWSLTLILLMGSASCEHTSKTKSGGDSAVTNNNKELAIAFYNVENLFDTEDDPEKMDEDFTPSGKYHWDQSRYVDKLNRIATVMNALPDALPVFIGLCEIENKKVLIDLKKQSLLKPGNYAIIHKDSPDERGIDVAAIYDSTRMKIETYNYIKVALPSESDPYTRDLLYVKGIINGEVVHLFVNHWPSRGGGQFESEPNRIFVAKILKSQTEEILAQDKNAKILIMGDFNDHPVDKSIVEILKAGQESNDDLFNYMYDDHVAGNGSYFYKGTWGALDQFMTSKNFLTATSGWIADKDAAHIFKDDMILFEDKEGIKRPNRTYAGEDYKGGFSDHLPIYIKLIWK